MYGWHVQFVIFTPDAAIQYNEAALPPIGVDCHASLRFARNDGVRLCVVVRLKVDYRARPWRARNDGKT